MKGISSEQINAINKMIKEGKSHVEIGNILNLNSLQVSLIASKSNASLVNNESQFQSLDSVDLKNATESRKQNGIPVGIDKDGRLIAWEPTDTANPHLLVVGESGYGKTYTIIALICELNKRRIPTFIIDYSSSYSADKFPPSLKTQINELQVGGLGISLNPLEVSDEDILGPVSATLRLEGTFARMYQLGVQQLNVLREALLQCYLSKGITRQRDTWKNKAPNIRDFEHTLIQIAEDPEDHRKSIASKLLGHISDFFICQTFKPTGLPFNWRTELNTKKINILQLKGLEGRTQRMVTEFLIWDCYRYMVSGGEKALSAYLVLDEAHNLSFKPDAPVDKILREARKFGLGAIIASQQPDDFSDVAFSNTGTKICFQVSAERGKFLNKLAAKSKKSVDEIRNTITTIPKFHAYVLSNNSGMSCKIISLQQRNL